MTAPRLVHMGGAVVDYVYRIASLPTLGGEAVADAFDRLPGGGFNMMVAAARAGMTVAYGGGHGAGDHGDRLRTALREAGIEILQPINPEIDSGCCTVMVTDDAERSFVSWSGAEGVLCAEVLSALQAGRADWIFLSGYTLAYAKSRDALSGWIETLPATAPVLFDPSPLVRQIPTDLLTSLLRRVTWVSCAAAEAAAIAGSGEAVRQAERLLERHCPAAAGVVLRDGSAGCVLKLRGQPALRVPGFPVRAVDTNGAGDVHVGAFVAALSRGVAPLDAVRYANAAAAIAVTRHGGSNAPHDDEIRAFLSEARREASV
ncbi:MAG: PfkB family carbohydrate kinase [Alphaproteobacteria bacterium]